MLEVSSIRSRNGVPSRKGCVVIMRQLLEDFREKRLSPSKREALMRAAGGQFTQLLTQHWKEKSNPPRWLVSLFRPASAPASAAQVNQMKHSPYST